jgi:hypothetical protein
VWREEKNKNGRDIFMKKFTAICMALVLMMTCTMFAFATDPEESAEDVTEVLDELAYTISATTSLSISGGLAYGGAIFTGYQGTTTKVIIKLTLQKKTLLIFWSDVAEGSKTTNSHSASYELTPRPSVESGKTYRIKAEYTAFSGSASESFTAYSPEKSS